jgi:hypothetical protein
MFKSVEEIQLKPKFANPKFCSQEYLREEGETYYWINIRPEYDVCQWQL